MFSRLQFRQVVRYTLITVVTVLLCGYVLWQARFLLIGPTVIITAEPPITSTERVIEIAGHAENIVRITLNGRQIFTDGAGNFNETVILEHGLTSITVIGTDRYGRETTVTRTTVYTPPPDFTN